MRHVWKAILVSCCLVPLVPGCKGGEGPLSLEVLCQVDVPVPDGVAPDGGDTGEDLSGRDLGPDALPDGLADVGPQDLPGPDLKDIPAGTFGASCRDNRDCESGYCIEGVTGPVCTKTCVEECPEGWMCRATYVGTDVVSLCVPEGRNLCKACTGDTQCEDGLCTTLGEGRFCTRGCEDGQCPAGFECLDLVSSETGITSKQCRPLNGTCSCRVSTEGQERPCIRESDEGTCLGIETCDPATGWVGCTAREPAAEACNGIDDDCNGVADDEAPAPGPECRNEVEDVGSCKGVYVCRGEAGWDCVGPIPAPEACNYLDEDCDGLTDEDFQDAGGRYVTDAHCGQCGVSCEGRVPYAEEVVCDGSRPAPLCVVTKCQDGFVKVADQICAPAVSNLCLPCVDDAGCGTPTDRCLEQAGGRYCGRDCAPGAPLGQECPTGYLCQDLGEGVQQCVPQSGTCECTVANAGIARLCQATNEAGTCTGTEVCDPAAGWVNCTARTPAAETCNGLDDDCDGFVDDGVVAPSEACRKEWTDPLSGETYACEAPWRCEESGSGVAWVCKAAEPRAEECNGRDDNCDGRVDEDFKVPGTEKYGTLSHCGSCGVTCEGLVPHASMACNTVPAVPTCAVASCDAGYWKSSELACSEFPQTQCQQCANDRGCQVPGDACLALPGREARTCLWDCSEASLHPVLASTGTRCPEGYRCQVLDGTGQPYNRCVPLSGDCDCLAGNEGQVRLCAVQNAWGRCTGQEACDPSAGWLGCTAATPAPESCNGVDDDCNGLADEAWPSLGAVCTVGQGACTATGTFACDGSGTDVACSAVPGLPESESCNGADDDCNGLADEAWPDKGKPCFAGQGECLSAGVWGCSADGLGLACGARPGTPGTEACDDRDNDCDGDIDEEFPRKGTVCAAGVGECRQNGVYRCAAGGLDVACDAVPLAGRDERCNGLDDDCDGATDETWPLRGEVCVVGEGACRRVGTWACTEAGDGLACSAEEGIPTTERCNGADDDCDGAIDEDWPALNTACSEGVGACLRNGVNVCAADGSGLECNATAGAPAAEACNGIDDDCNGSIDETWPTKGTACTNGTGACLRSGVFACNAGGTAVQCDAVAGTPAAEACNGIDDNCNGGIDEFWPEKNTACSVGVGACLRNGVNVCNAGGTALECNATAGTPTAESCNGIDDNCNGGIDEAWPTKGTACTNGTGACLRSGVFACNAGGTGVQCDAVAGTPVAESCNGIDDNCNGGIDETWPAKNTACSVGVGACLRNGVNVCNAGGTGIECSVAAGSPTTETCNGIDDDCNGLVDDAFPTKGQPCTNGTGACLRTGVYACNATGTGVQCDAVAGSPVAETCNGIDDNCNGGIDETWPSKNTSCSVGVGACLRNGVNVCNAPGTALECNAAAGSPTTETCNGIDDDCNGLVDDAFPTKGQPCTNGTGACLRTGVYVCNALGTGVQCNAVAGSPVAETCNGIDDNCNGSIDESWPARNTACSVGVGACLRNGVSVCNALGTALECNVTAGTPVAETCNGVDDNCNGTVDDGFPTKGQPCTNGVGACLRTGVFACNAPGTGVQCDAVAGSPTAESCNGIDDNCNGTVDDPWPTKGQACANGVGECRRAGVLVCTADGTAIACDAVAGTPVAEKCNDRDDDCNGAVDNGFPLKGTVCTDGVGQCIAAGTWECTADGSATDCNAVPGLPLPESCNYLDDDCDGTTDDGFVIAGRYVADTGCGNCFTDCTQIWTSAIHHARGVCDAVPADPLCTYVCDAGWADADTNPDNGCELYLDPLAIYVSTPVNGGSNFTGCGAWDAPCATIGYGLGRAQALSKARVLVAEGIYPENVVLQNGISVLGGHNAATWWRDPDTNISVIQGTTAVPGKHLKAVVADGITATTEFSGFTVYGEANFYSVAGDSGGNSYAVWVRDSSSALRIADNILYGGRASGGSAAVPGISGVNGVDGGAGTNGQETGSPTCVGGVPRAGGTGGTSPCGANGGAGATAVCPSNNDEQADGTAGTAVASGGTAGAGGLGGNDAKVPNTPCNQPIYASGTTKFGGFGTGGTDGTDGTGGLGCALATGTVTGGEWVGAQGTTGIAGTTGGGGGGGGAGGGVDIGNSLNCNAGDTLGGGGGGGGGGGCGGSAGGAGKPGGGSFAIFIVRTASGPATAPVLANNVVIRNQGGFGGDGGDGGIGGAGGQGGQGGNVAGLYYEFAAGTGGFGGAGGDGGHGGGGGGGCGGGSYGVFTWNLSALSPNYCTGGGNTYGDVGGAGAGGLGGQSNGTAGTPGLPGIAQHCNVQ